MTTSENIGKNEIEGWRIQNKESHCQTKYQPTKLEDITHALPYLTWKEIAIIIWLIRHFLGPKVTSSSLQHTFVVQLL